MRRVWLPWPPSCEALRWCREVAILDMGASLVSMRAAALPSLHHEGSFFATPLQKVKSRTQVDRVPIHLKFQVREDRKLICGPVDEGLCVGAIVEVLESKCPSCIADEVSDQFANVRSELRRSIRAVNVPIAQLGQASRSRQLPYPIPMVRLWLRGRSMPKRKPSLPRTPFRTPRPTPRRRLRPATRSSASWAAAAWGSSMRPGKRNSIASWP